MTLGKKVFRGKPLNHLSVSVLVSFEFTIRYELQLEGKAPFKRGLATALTSSSTNSYFLASTVA